jgi:hypothetical protein
MDMWSIGCIVFELLALEQLFYQYGCGICEVFLIFRVILFWKFVFIYFNYIIYFLNLLLIFIWYYLLFLNLLFILFFNFIIIYLKLLILFGEFIFFIILQASLQWVTSSALSWAPFRWAAA